MDIELYRDSYSQKYSNFNKLKMRIEKEYGVRD